MVSIGVDAMFLAFDENSTSPGPKHLDNDSDTWSVFYVGAFFLTWPDVNMSVYSFISKIPKKSS